MSKGPLRTCDFARAWRRDHTHAAEGLALIEFGAVSTRKVRLLLDLPHPPSDLCAGRHFGAKLLVQGGGTPANKIIRALRVAVAADFNRRSIAKAHCRHGNAPGSFQARQSQFEQHSGEGISAKCRQNIGTWLDFGGRRPIS